PDDTKGMWDSDIFAPPKGRHHSRVSTISRNFELHIDKSKIKVMLLTMLRPIVNQKLIAKQLKLSPATVSKSFRNHPDIKPETRAKVLNQAARLGYHVDLNGRGVRYAQA